MKAFFYHGFSNFRKKNHYFIGLLSTTEAVFFGIPVVGVPVFFDQSLNMKMAEEKGYGINVPYEILSEKRLKSAIRQMLTNSRFLSNASSWFYYQIQFTNHLTIRLFSYAETAKLISQRFHDQLNTPMETALHWVEHVAKNRGSLYLQSAGVRLPFLVYHNLDVWAFIVINVGVTSYILLKLLQSFWSTLGTSPMYKLKVQ